jgi:uncharacterized protein
MKILSNYSHLIQLNGRYMLYNALTTKLILLKKDQFESLEFDKSLESSFTVDEIKLLSEKGFLNDNNILSVNRLIEDNQQQTPKLFALYLILTEHCNMNCTYCSQSAYRTRPRLPNMSLKTIKNTLDRFYLTNANRTRTIVLYGGEPTLNKSGVMYAVNYIREIKNDKKAEIVIFTNAILLDDTLIDFFDRNNVSIIVSIDGPKTINDSFRLIDNRGSFDRINNAIRKIQAHNIRFGISATIASHNIQNLPSIVSFFCEEYHPFSIGLNPLHYVPEEREIVSVDSDEMSKMMLNAYEVAAGYGIYIEQIMRRVRPFVLEQPRLKDCPSCGGMIRVLPDGSFGPCGHFMEEEKDREDNNKSYQNNLLIIKWNERLSCSMKKCQDCAAMALCGGGCPFNSFKHGGDFFSPADGRSCSQAHIFLNWLFEKTIQYIPEETFYEVSLKDKQKILGKISLEEHVPLGNYSQYGEFKLPEQYL